MVPLEYASGAVWRRMQKELYLDIEEGSRALPPREVFPQGAAGAVITTDSAGRINFLNSAAETLTGWSKEQADGRPLGEIVSRLCHFDSLTNLPNRRLLCDPQASRWPSRAGGKGAVLFLDLDQFRRVNDSLGHRVGDQLLRIVAWRLSIGLQARDTVSRLSGDEFVIVLADVSGREAAAGIAQEVLERLAAPVELQDGHRIHITASLGISLFPDDGKDMETLLQHAETAMYEVKERGRGFYRFFKPEMSQQAVERHQIENNIQQALANHEFQLHYQPQIEIGSGRIVGAEALIRWQRPNGVVMAPGKFIPIAEECGLVSAIGEWVLQEACRQNMAWQQAGLPAIPVAVNVSAAQFQRDDFLDVVRGALGKSGLDPRHLEVEVTEGVIMHAAEETIVRLQALKAMGIQLSVDDFGTGYSSLAYLKRFPVDRLKIDQAFVHDLATGRDDQAIARAIINLAQNLQLEVIAEGVETKVQCDFLKANGCDRMQGYLFSKPLPPDDFARLIAH
jgi:diguanylate cyclase (GGDEF)-like protein